MKKLLYKPLFTIGLVLFPLFGFAQTEIPVLKGEDIKFEKISTEQGLSNNSILCIIQDNKGFLWIGTSDGLNKFDGYSITNYYYNPDDPNSLSGNSIQAILEDDSGKLWIGTREGLNKFNPKTEKFTVFKYDPQDSESLSHNNVRSIFEDSSGTLWIGTWGGGLNKLVPPAPDSSRSDNEGSPPTFIHFQHSPQDPESLSDNWILTIFEDSSCRLWIGTNGGLNKFDRKTEKFTIYKNDPLNPESLSHNTVKSILEDNSGIIWIGTNKGGLNKFIPPATFIHYQHNPKNPGSLSDNNVRSIFEDSSGRLWIGTYTGGLNKFDPKTEKFTVYKNDPQDPESLSQNSVTPIIEDSSGILWIGTGGGLNKFDPKIKKITAYKHNPQDQESLSRNAVRSIIEDKSGIIWIGTVDGLNKLDRKTGNFTVYKNDPLDRESLSHNLVMSILEDKSGNLWIGTGNGLNKFDLKTEKLTVYPESFSRYYIISILGDKSGNIWIGTIGGLFKFNPKTEKFTVYKNDPKDPESLSHNVVISIFEDSSGNLWIGTEAGWLNKLDPKTEKFTGYKNDPNDPNSLSHNNVRSIFEDGSGTLWFGTGGGGLNKLVPNPVLSEVEGTGGGSGSDSEGTDRFTHYTTKDGLPNNTVYDLLEDDKGNIWISTGKGVSRFNPKTEEFKNYSILENLHQDDEFHGTTAYKSKSGEMFFGGINGFITFSPDSINSIKDNPFIPPVVITKFKLFNESVFPGEDSPLKYSISETNKIELTYSQNFFSFEFAALSYSNPGKNQYKYKMEGLDKDWVEAGTRRFAEYRDLKPGKYVFRVQGSNNDGIWNEEGTSIRIIINPPWWKTKFAYILYVIAIIFIIYAYIKFKEKKLQKDKKVLEEKVKERTAEVVRQKNAIQEKNKELTQQKEEIVAQRDEIESQKDIVTNQRDQLAEQKEAITQSIKYASRIQSALLPPDDFIRYIFTEYFILNKPRDIVSGDFYWVSLKNNKIIFAVADCTGHGVPGALMSTLGGVLLNDVVNKIEVLQANEILNELKEQVIIALRQSGQESETKVGMDIALCILNKENKELQFAGACNPLYLIRDSEVKEIKADSMPVGIGFEAGKSFTNHIIKIRKGDAIYLFSDGYPDQFGGPTGEKFKYTQFKKLLLNIQDKIMLDQKDILEHTIEDWMNNTDKYGNSYEQVDDILVMGIKF